MGGRKTIAGGGLFVCRPRNKMAVSKKSPTKKEWYQTCWGFVIVIIFLLPFFVWWTWAKSGWTPKVKWIVTATVAAFIIITMATGNSSPPTAQTSVKKSPSKTATSIPSSSASPTPSPSVTPTPTPTQTESRFSPGRETTLKDMGLLFMGTTEDNWSKLLKYIQAKDNIGVANMLYIGEALEVDGGSKIKVIEVNVHWTTGAIDHIRVLEGKNALREGWISDTFVQ